MPTHRYPKQCYIMLKNLDDHSRHTYATEVRNLLFSYGFGYIWISQDIGNINMFISEFKIRLKDSLQQDWHNALSNSSKTQYYMQFKSLLNVERYLTIDIPFYLRKAFAKFRCSDHKLNIEVGRHHNAPKEERICTYCLEKFAIVVIEDEFHVFLFCKRYEKFRKIYIGDIKIKTADVFIRFMSCCDRTNIFNICKLVHKILMMRNEESKLSV